MKKLFLLMLVAIALSISTFAQEEIVVGTGIDVSTNFRSPSQTNFKYSYAQNIYHVSEINMGGIITSIAYKPTASNIGTRTWRILMGETSLNSFTSNCIPVSNLTEVFVGEVSFSTSDWVTITLETPFSYSADSNLVIAIEDQTGTMGTNTYWESTIEQTDNRSWRVASDYNVVTAENPGTSPQIDNYFPNVKLTILASGTNICYSPATISTTDVEETSVTISWTESEGMEGSSYTLQYKPFEDSWEDNSVVELYADNVTSIEISDLLPSKTYSLRIKTECSETASLWKNTIFSTACGIVTNFPWIENFENAWFTGADGQLAPHCWRVFDVNGDNDKWTRTTNTPINGLASATLYTDYNTANNDWLVSPLMELDGNKQLSFYARNRTTYTAEQDEIAVYISDEDIELSAPTSTTDDLPGFTRLFQTMVPIGDAQFYEIPLQGYSGNRYIAFVRKEAPADGFYLYLDDVMVSDIPACTRPNNLSSTTTSGSATLSWTSTGENFTLYYKVVGDNIYSVLDDIQLNENGEYVLNGLISNKEYAWYVVANCNDGISLASGVQRFATLCESIVDLPWGENFNDTPISTIPDCWKQINPYSGYPKVTNNHARSGRALEFQANNYSGVTQYAVLPPFETNLNELQLSFWTRREGSYSGTFSVGYMTNPNDVNTFVALNTFTGTTIGDNEYHKITLNYADIELEDGQTGNIAFSYSNTANWYWYVDDIIVDLIPDCVEPNQLSAIPSSNSANLSWNSNVSNYNVHYRVAGSEEDYTIDENISLNSEGIYTIENLSPTTTYQWYVAAICNDGTLLSSEPALFTTSCVGLTELPYTCDFETLPEGSYPVPSCWTKGNANTTYPYINESSYNAQSGNGYLCFYTPNTIALTSIDRDVIEITETQVSFYAKGNGNVLQIGVMTNPEDVNTFTQVSGLTLTDNYVLYEVPLTTYEGEGSYVAFKNIADNYLYIDNVTLEKIPSCSRPVGLSASLTEGGMELSWTSDANNFVIYYKKVGSSEYVEVNNINETNYTLSEFEHSSAYQWYVKAICGDDTDPQSLVYTFFTPCDLVTSLPLSWDFENYDETTNLPICWTVYNRNSNNGYPKVESYTDSRSGSNLLYFYSSNPISTLVLPPVDTDIYPINTLQLRFWAKHSPNYDGWKFSIMIGVMTDFNDPSTWVEVDTICVNRVQEYTEYVLSLANYTGEGKYIALRGKSIESVMWCKVDDMVLETIGTQQPIEPTVVTNAATGITQTSATLNGAITDLGNQTMTARGFEWKATVGGTYTSVSATGTTMTYALSGLTANTSYTYKAFVTTANGTQYGDEVTFTTLEQGEEPCTPETASETIIVCFGETAEFYGQTLTEGTNTITVSGQGEECDTIYTITLIVRPENTKTINLTINSDELPYQFGTQSLTTGGTFTENFTDENGCDSTVVLTLTVNSSINDVENGINVMLYPNPTTEDAMLRVEGINSDATIYVTDVQGRTIKETKLAQGEQEVRIETSTLASGVYYIRIVTDTINRTEKLIKK
ncbi:MAG: choice-of-anchor J domain-containing protein [Bacteroidales bacterium]|nr:choice-of-anchor J domain-containing protein [Bacteroidales bacterium]